jgi:TonB-dependent SusC/RagA subfamily outer membrane receptor
MKRIFIVCATLLFILGSLKAQERVVTGLVTNAEDGSTLPGVTVMVKGTNVGTITAVDGTYEIRVMPDAVLVFSFIGMETQEVAVGNRTVINVALESEIATLSEFVVTAVGIERTTRSLGYSVSSVDAAATQQKSELDVLRTLQGKIPGVNISGSSGAAGSATRITIRGTSSFFGNNQPLIIVDGIPYSNEEFTTSNRNSGGGAYGSGLSTLDPNNIKSMNVLKGAAAAALYGSRASNGVVVIETKTGNATRTRKGLEVNLNLSNAWENIANLPEYQNSYGAGVDFRYAGANGSWGPHFNDLDSIPLWGEYAQAFPDMPQNGSLQGISKQC